MAKKKTYKTLGLFSIYGVRESSSEDRFNISIVQKDENGNKVFGCISIPKKGTKNVKVKKSNDAEVVLSLPRLDIGDEDED